MNYFEKHIGDYLKDTAHLSLLEHGVYNRLFDVYYTREGGIPAVDAARLVGARTKEEKAALVSVLAEFFVLRDGLHVQDRCDREIARYQGKQAKAKASADARWGAQRAQSERNANASAHDDATGMRTHSEGNAPRARPHTPDTKHQTPDTNTHTVEADPTEPGRVSGLIRQAGVGDASPGHLEFRTLIDAGVSDDEWLEAARITVDKGKRFDYLLGIVKSRRTEAAQTARTVHRGAMPAAETNTQRAQRERAAAFAPSVAAKAPTPERPATAEVIDVTARRLG